MNEFSARERAILRKLSTPAKIQDFLNTIPTNFESGGETCKSPRRLIHERSAHCLEGALFAAAALAFHGEKPLVMHLKTIPTDDAHAVALYRKNGYWGAISKTNHAVLRFRDPVYKTLRELALSYFHEYFVNKTGLKTLRGFAGPVNLFTFGKDWLTSDEDLWHIAYALKDMRHTPLLPEKNKRYIRKADSIERRAGTITEWKRGAKRV